MIRSTGLLACLLTTWCLLAAEARAQPEFKDVFESATGKGGLLLIRGDDAKDRPDLGAIEGRNPGQSRREVARSFLTELNESSRSYLERSRNDAAPGSQVDLDAQLGREPVTVVVFPGIFGEFIDTRAFEEVFERSGSSFEREWQRALSGRGPVTDRSYSLQELREIERPLEDLISVASMDAPDGSSLVNVMLLRTPKLSLESAGSVDDISSMFLRRVNRFFDVLGRVPENVIFVGYSMGTTTALDTLSKARASGEPWLPSVKGMVSLAGVNFGSTAADVALSPDGDAPSSVQLRLLRKLADDLEVPSGGWWSKRTARMRNVRRWAKFASEILPTLGGMGAGPRPKLSTLDPQKAHSLLERAIIAASTTFDVSLSDAAHVKNVRRWKYFVRRVLDGVGELTTEARLDWWATHEIPADVKYYAVAGSLTEEPDADGVSLDSVDHAINLGGFRDYTKSGGSSLNDGQVGMHQARFWPELSTYLNPNQDPFQAEFLGLYHTHHWGLALRTGVAGENPFPREALLKALAAKASSDIEASGARSLPAPVKRPGAIDRLPGR